MEAERCLLLEGASFQVVVEASFQAVAEACLVAFLEAFPSAMVAAVVVVVVVREAGRPSLPHAARRTPWKEVGDSLVEIVEGPLCQHSFDATAIAAVAVASVAVVVEGPWMIPSWNSLQRLVPSSVVPVEWTVAAGRWMVVVAAAVAAAGVLETHTS